MYCMTVESKSNKILVAFDVPAATFHRLKKYVDERSAGQPWGRYTMSSYIEELIMACPYVVSTRSKVIEPVSTSIKLSPEAVERLGKMTQHWAWNRSAAITFLLNADLAGYEDSSGNAVYNGDENE